MRLSAPGMVLALIACQAPSRTTAPEGRPSAGPATPAETRAETRDATISGPVEEPLADEEDPRGPEAVCRHVVDLVRMRPGAALPDATFNVIENGCRTELGAQQEAEPEAYAGRAECLLAASDEASMEPCPRPGG